MEICASTATDQLDLDLARHCDRSLVSVEVPLTARRCTRLQTLVQPASETDTQPQKNRPGDQRLTGRAAFGRFAVTSVLVLATWPMVITALQSALDGLLG